MKQIFTFLSIILLFTISYRAYTQTTYTWANAASGGVWNSASNWVPNTGFPGSGDNVVIDPTAPITITNVPAIAVNSITIAGAGLADSVILTSTQADTLTINDNVTVTGGGIFVGTNLALNFISCSSYIHNMNGGDLPFAIWGANSNCNIIGITNTGPGNMSQTFYNFLWDCPNQSGTIFFYNGHHNFPTGMNGTCEFRRFGTNQCNWDPADGTVWAGDLIVSSNRNLILTNNSPGAVTFSVRDVYLNNQYGAASKLLLDNEGNTSAYLTFNMRNLIVEGGILDFNGIWQNNTNVNVSGDLTLTAGAITIGNSGYNPGISNFNFTGTRQQNINITGGTITGNNYDGGLGGPSDYRTLSINVATGSTVNFNTPLVCNIGGVSVLTTFNAASGSTLMIPDPAGILNTAGATTGSVRMPTGGAVTFSTGANYIYNGTVAQTTGIGLPATVNNFAVNNPLGVSLTNNLSINGAFALTDGNLTLGAKNITLLTPATLAGSFSNSNMVVASSTGQFIRSIASGSGSYTFPIGDATPNYSPVTLNFVSNTTAGTVGARVTNSVEPNNATPSAPSSYLSRYWTFANTGLSSYSYTGTFTYPEVNVTGTESEIKLSQWTGTAWFEDDTGSSALSGVLTLSDALSQVTAPLSGDFTGRVQTAATCTAPTLNAKANGTATSLTICSGGAPASVSLTANATSGTGCTGTFQYAWFNGTNYWNGTSFASATPVFSSAYSTISYSASASAVYTVSGQCSNNTSCVSNSSVTVNLPASVTPSVSIYTQFPVLNSDTAVTFVATPVNGGSSPSYQWKKNGVNVGTNSNTYADTTANNNDVITCILTSNIGCPTSVTATSNPISISVFEKFTPTIAISAAQTTICSQPVDTFTALSTNEGTLPSFQWRKNGINVGTNSAIYIDSSLTSNDVVYCILTSNANCLALNTATSNSITLIAGNSVTPSVTITNSGDTVCAGTAVQFTAMPTSGGPSPIYQWKINGVNTGTNSPNFSSNSLRNNDTVICVLTSSDVCASGSPVNSNLLIVSVDPLLNAGHISAEKDTVCSGTEASLTVTGSTGNIQWQSSPTGANFTDISNATDTTYSATLSQSAFFREYTTGVGCNDTSATLLIITDTVPVAPSPTTNNNRICSGDSTQVCVDGGYASYLWSNGATTNCTYATVAGGYWVTVSNAGGCSAISSHLAISVFQVPSVSVIVQGDTLSSYGEPGYQWLYNDSIIKGATSPLYIASKAGSYSVQVTDTNGCKANSTEIVITGITDLSESGISVYPNPSLNGNWQLQVDNNLVGSKLEIYDDNGRLVFQSEIRNPKSEISFNAGAGVYLLRIYTSGSNVTRRLVRL